MDNLPFVSIIVPTYNRDKMLSITIDSFLVQNYPEDKFEIIIANNNSTDNTQQIINEYCKKYPDKVKTVFESRQGVHYARNNAAKSAKGNILYYTDDDMIADKDLLKNIVQVFLIDEKVASASGKVLPKWEINPPDWILKYCNNSLLSLNDLGDETIVKNKDMGVFSCHQAMRKDVFFQSGGFNPENTAGKWIGDGETGLNIKIKDLGYKFAYVGTSVIYHMIPPTRMTQAYLDKRLFNQGNCDSYTAYKKHKYSSKILFKQILRYINHIKKRLIKTISYKLLNKDKWRIEKAYVHYYLARIKYNFRLMHDKNWQKLVLIDN